MSALRRGTAGTTSRRTGRRVNVDFGLDLVLNGLAIVLAPIIALWVGGILQRRSDAHKAKLSIFATLVGLRHTPLSAELVRSLNQIDAVFVDDPAVREAWTRYYTALNDANLGAAWRLHQRGKEARTPARDSEVTQTDQQDLIRGPRADVPPTVRPGRQLHRISRKGAEESSARGGPDPASHTIRPLDSTQSLHRPADNPTHWKQRRPTAVSRQFSPYGENILRTS